MFNCKRTFLGAALCLFFAVVAVFSFRGARAKFILMIKRESRIPFNLFLLRAYWMKLIATTTFKGNCFLWSYVTRAFANDLTRMLLNDWWRRFHPERRPTSVPTKIIKLKQIFHLTPLVPHYFSTFPYKGSRLQQKVFDLDLSFTAILSKSWKVLIGVYSR